MRRPLAAASAVAIGLAVIWGAGQAGAAAPRSVTVGPSAASAVWTGRHYAVGATPSALACPQAVDADDTLCDHLGLVVAADAAHWKARDGGAYVGIRWPSADDNFDLYVFTSGGRVAAASTSPRSTSEQVFLPEAAGSYEIRVVPVLVKDSSYLGGARFHSVTGQPAPEPVPSPSPEPTPDLEPTSPPPPVVDPGDGGNGGGGSGGGGGDGGGSGRDGTPRGGDGGGSAGDGGRGGSGDGSGGGGEGDSDSSVAQRGQRITHGDEGLGHDGGSSWDGWTPVAPGGSNGFSSGEQVPYTTSRQVTYETQERTAPHEGSGWWGGHASAQGRPAGTGHRLPGYALALLPVAFLILAAAGYAVFEPAVPRRRGGVLTFLRSVHGTRREMPAGLTRSALRGAARGLLRAGGGPR